MRLSLRGLQLEESEAQTGPRIKRIRGKRRRIGAHKRVMSKTSSALFLWVSLAFCAVSRRDNSNLTPYLVTATEAEHENVTRRGKNVRSDLTPEQEAQLDDFLRMLQDHAYVSMLVEENNAAKPISYSYRKGPPVMIGRRRSLLEHTMQHHYSLQFLKHLTSDPKNVTDEQQTQSPQQEGNSNSQKAFRYLQEALDTYLFQTNHDAYIKANPQRHQHNAATANSVGLPPFPPSLRASNVKLLRDMFYNSYDAYMEYSFPAAELKPMTCQPGTFDLIRLPALTLIDALDTLLVLGDSVEFAKSVERLRQLDMEYKAKGQAGLFAVDQNVSVFETNIRVLGGLLSAHQMAMAFLKTDKTTGSDKLPPVSLASVFDPPDDPYLQQSEDVQRRLDHYEKQRQRFETSEADQSTGRGGTCPIVTPAGSSEGGSASEVPQEGSNDVWDTCGSGISALEECAQNQAKCKSMNQTMAKQTILKQLEPQWEYDGFLLELALDIGERLLPAFDTRTGIPYGTANLLHGIPKGETTVASLAGGGTLSLEMELLSRLTGDLRFGKAAKLAMRALWVRRSSLHLLGKHIDVHRGTWTETLSGIGSNSDSFLEYLLKHYLLFPEEKDFWIMLQAAYTGVFHDSRLGEWYADVDMKTGLRQYPKGLVKRVLESLMAFYPGMQTLMGEWVPAARSLNSFFMAREYLGFLPERFSYIHWKVDGGVSSGAAKHPLRPELLESCYFMHRATKRATGTSGSETSGWLWASDFALHHLERLTRANCGYASVRGLNPGIGNLNVYQTPEQVRLFNEMPSFFLSETIKYLYLTFDDDNILHTDDNRDWIFTTEAHPIHSVPTPAQHEDAVQNPEGGSPYLDDLKAQLRGKLTTMKRQRDLRRSGLHSQASSLESTALGSSVDAISATYLQEESWSDNTQPRQYRSSLSDVSNIVKQDIQNASSNARTDLDPLTAFFGNETSMLLSMKLDINVHLFQEEGNLAHMSFNSLGLGNGYALRKACPNIYAPELLWVHALSGGAVDYTDIYISALSEIDEDYPSPNDSIQLLLTSAEALSMHGSGVYLGNMDTEINLEDQCPIPDGTSNGKFRERKQHTQANQTYSASESPSDEAPGQKQGATLGSQLVELAGLGTFEVSAFPEGSGFYMQRTETGESVIATFLAEGSGGSTEEARDVYVMAYASMPRRSLQMDADDGVDEVTTTGGNDENVNETDQDNNKKTSSPWKLVGPRLASLFRNTRKGKNRQTGHKDMDEEMDSPARAVVLADLQGNSFHCDVNIVRRSLPSTKETMEGDEQGVGHESTEEILLATMPCAPALFGPTHMSKLISTNGVFVEHTILSPNATDEFGCGPEDHVPTATTPGDNQPRNVEVDERGSEDDYDDGTHPSDAGKEETNGHRVIQLVRRGQCSFYNKSVQQKKRVNADAVIVINTDDNELFVMSHGDEEQGGAGEDELPAAVLVTGLDGENILQLIESENRENSSRSEEQKTYIVAQVSILKQETKIDENGSIVPPDGSSIDWPFVLGSEDSLQIFAEGGWGIHAVRMDGGKMREHHGTSGKDALQLFLLRHTNKQDPNNEPN